MLFAEELERCLPDDLPERAALVEKGARHLELIVEANQQFNLTRILDEKEAAIKHVFDSVAPWKLFAGAKRVLDAGTGAGFPGIPLGIVLPEVRFTLCESIQKKARFVENTVASLELKNARVEMKRAEELGEAYDIITARAVAPVERALKLFAPAIRRGAKVLLYKGPDAEKEIIGASGEIRRLGFHAEVVLRYELPEALGTRTVVKIGR